MNLVKRLEKAIDIIAVPTERHAQLRINRGDAEELWELLKELLGKELDDEASKPRVEGKKRTKITCVHPGNGLSHVTEESPQTTDPLLAGDYDIGTQQAWYNENKDRMVSWGKPAPYTGWYLKPRNNRSDLVYREAGFKGQTIYTLYPEKMRELLQILSQQAMEAQEPEIREETRSGIIGSGGVLIG